VTFLRRHHLWPIWEPGLSLWGRMRWVLWRWWTWEILRWHRQRTCSEHEPISVQVGLLREVVVGGGHQRVMCSRCGVTIRDFTS
jgi:hypothetical protein